MTETLEERKAAALKEIDWNGHTTAQWLTKYEDVIRELLSPSVEVADGEVDMAIKYYSHIKDEKIQALILAAQQHRQEWIPVRMGEFVQTMLGNNYPNSWAGFHDALEQNKFAIVKLPEPPKVTA